MGPTPNGGKMARKNFDWDFKNGSPCGEKIYYKHARNIKFG